jgi:hypothetical protein
MLKPDLAPAAAASTTRSMSGSLRKGITGETLTPTGMPAWVKADTASRRRWGLAARGSRIRARAGSSVVTDR